GARRGKRRPFIYRSRPRATTRCCSAHRPRCPVVVGATCRSIMRHRSASRLRSERRSADENAHLGWRPKGGRELTARADSTTKTQRHKDGLVVCGTSLCLGVLVLKAIEQRLRAARWVEGR